MQGVSGSSPLVSTKSRNQTFMVWFWLFIFKTSGLEVGAVLANSSKWRVRPANDRRRSSPRIESSCLHQKITALKEAVIFLSKPLAWYIIECITRLRRDIHSYIISPCGAVSHARARSPFARWHSVLRSVFDGTLAEQSARGSLVQARTHSRLIIAL